MKPFLTILLAFAAFVFWRFCYPHALAFQEQLQLFLFDSDYLCSRLIEPGGVARYVAEFLVQFYNNVNAGAAIVSLLYVALQLLVWQLMKPARDYWYGLSFVPVILFWIVMGDEKVMPTALVALIMALCAMVCCPKGKATSISYLIIVMPLLYWAIGPFVAIVGVYAAVVGRKGMGALMWGIAAVLYFVIIFITSSWFLPYPLIRLFLGLDYYRYVEVMPYLLAVIPFLCLILAVSGDKSAFLDKFRKHNVVSIFSLFLILGLLAGGLLWGYEERTYRLIEYDYLVRANQWDAIIAKSEKKQPDLPMSVCATNLALAMKGQLGDRAFEFYQRGVDGLLPNFERNYASQQLIGEAYFQLGLVNTAQRLAFEAMEAIPNYNKSVRAVKRLAETNLINGQYDVANKYLNMLTKTIFYHNWAKRTQRLLGKELDIAKHPLYGKIREWRLNEDFLFSKQELDKICGRLYLHNNSNTIAKQYLLLYPILERDIDKFVDYVQVVQNKEKYNPRSCQETIAYAFLRKNQMPSQGLVGQMVVNQLQEFVTTLKEEGNDSPKLEAFKNTVWYYLTKEE